jgi:fatty acid desaturase
MLRRFDVGPAEEGHFPRYEWEGYHELRTRVMARLKREGWRPGPSRRGAVVATLCLLLCVATPLLWPLTDETGAPLLFKLGLGALYVESFISFGGFGHAFLHQNSRLGLFGDMMTLSSYEWKTTHCIEHHGYTNHPELDNNVRMFEPLTNFAPGRDARFQRLAPFLILPTYALGFMMLRIMMPIDMWRDPSQLGRRLALYLIGSCGWLVLWWSVGHLWVGVGLEAVISFVFCFLTMSSHNTESCHAALGTRDFVQFQLDAASDFGSTNYWSSMLLGFFLGMQSLHHLFPMLDPSYLPIVDEELRAMGYRRNVRSFWRHCLDYMGYILKPSARA